MAEIATAGASFFSATLESADGGYAIEELKRATDAAVRGLGGARSEEGSIPCLLNYVDGEWRGSVAESVESIDVFNPSTGSRSCQVQKSSQGDVDAAVNAAHAAQAGWANTPGPQRAAILEKVASLLRERADTLGLLESCDVGKPVKLAQKMDIPRAAENFDFFARMIRTDSTEAHHMADAINITQRCAVGVSALITPWNLPLYLLTWKVAPALACGNAVIVKPSELTPLTATALADILQDAGLPKGVFNLVHGFGADIGGHLTSHPKVRLVSFTGGTVTGRKVASSAAPSFKKCSLELGGKNPAIVFADADLEEAAESVTRGAFLNSGQICLCCPRILIEESIYEEFKEMLKAKALQLGRKVGDPMKPDTVMGPVISADHQKKIHSYVELARKDGGKVLTGGQPPLPQELPARCKEGYFYLPTILEGLDHTSRVVTEEIFGPVCTLHPFKDEAEALSLANNVEYGLASSLWTNNNKRALRFSHGIHTGMVWVNCWMHRDLRVPFGGTKQSGLGHEGGKLSIDFYSEPKNICLKM